MGKLQEVYKKHFRDKKMLNIRFTQGQLQDIREEDEQWNIVYKEHYRAHRGAEENERQLLRKFYFPKHSQKVRDFTANCKICHENKYERNPSKHPIQETPIPKSPFEISHIDILFLENETFLTYNDKFSKFAQIRPVASRAAVDLIPAIKDLLTKYRTPDILVMDGKKSFATGELLNFYNQNNIETTGRSEMNGTVERFHSTILEIYRITKAENPTMTLRDLLILSVNKYNNTIHGATKHTPQEIIFPKPRDHRISL